MSESSGSTEKCLRGEVQEVVNVLDLSHCESLHILLRERQARNDGVIGGVHVDR